MVKQKEVLTINQCEQFIQSARTIQEKLMIEMIIDAIIDQYLKNEKLIEELYSSINDIIRKLRIYEIKLNYIDEL